MNLTQKIGDSAAKAVVSTKEYVCYHLGKKVTHVFLAALALTGGGVAMTLKAQTARADSLPVYTVTDNAAGGVWARQSPHTIDTLEITGDGVYPGDQVELICGVTNGDPVGPFNNTTWHYINDDTRPSEGQFWVADHHLNTPNPPSQMTPGEVPCGTNNTAVPGNPPANPATPYMVGNCAMDAGGYILSMLPDPYTADGLSLNDPNQTHDNSQTLVCVHAQTGVPDHVNHRQFVGTVEAEAPYVDPPGCPDTNYLLEIWGDGFYQSTDCTAPTVWTINQWVADGTNICAAISDDFEDGTLGAFNAYRTITCIHITA
ncbi:MAG TPA: hypothetical protein VNG51_10130 [Ktedonobacteraceae bacterium]|nr:hypothetical protein [Ktedonobacteraceae bacterium]